VRQCEALEHRYRTLGSLTPKSTINEIYNTMKNTESFSQLNPLTPNLVESSYLDILPLGKDKIDIFMVFNRVYPQVTKWMDLFFNQKTWETDIHSGTQFTDLFRHFYFESKNIQRTRGQQVFAFGFPLVVEEERTFIGSGEPSGDLVELDLSESKGLDIGMETRKITAPLFTWYLSIKPHPNRKDSWLIGHDETHPVVANQYLIQFFRKKYGIDLSEKLNKVALARDFGLYELDTLCRDIARQLGYVNENLNSGLRECPNKMSVEQLSVVGDIAWSGVLGLFPHQEGSLKELAAEAADFQNSPMNAEVVHEFAVLPEDAHQRDALRTVLRNRITVIEGGHGTGKTHLAANILLNALSNGQKTAVVAEDAGSLMQIQNEFVNLGIEK
jgi:PhoH-like protein